MVKIIVNNIGVNELCYAITYDGYDSDAKLIPKNDTKHYFKYLIGWHCINDYKRYDYCNNYIDEFFIFDNIRKTYQIVELKEIFEFNEILVFDFPEDYPEEELFYFKLKYC